MLNKFALLTLGLLATAAASLLMLGGDGRAASSIAIDSTTICPPTAAGTITWSHTIGASSDRLLLVDVAFQPNKHQAVASVTYGGEALSPIVTQANGKEARAEIWAMVNPPTGTTDVVVALNGPGPHDTARTVCGATSYFGVDPVTPLGSPVSNQGNSNEASVDIPGIVDETVHDAVAIGSATTAIEGSAQDIRWEDVFGSSVRGAGSDAEGTGTVTMTWALSTQDQWAIVAVPIVPSGPAPSDTPTPTDTPEPTPTDTPEPTPTDTPEPTDTPTPTDTPEPTPTDTPEPTDTPTPTDTPEPTPTDTPEPTDTPTPTDTPEPTPTDTPSPTETPTPTDTPEPTPTDTPSPTETPTPTDTPEPTPTDTPSPTDTPTPTPVPSPTPPPAGSGDVNCSGEVNSVDALLVQRFAAALSVTQNEPCTDPGVMLITGWAMGDVDCDGAINSVDALMILRTSAALSVSLPVGCPPIQAP
jgi:hypothetical protein